MKRISVLLFCLLTPNLSAKNNKASIAWECQPDGYAHCFIDKKPAKKENCKKIERPVCQKKLTLEWKCLKDKQSHCYVNGKQAKLEECSLLGKRPACEKKLTQEWICKEDGWAHCLVDGQAAKKKFCDLLPRPSCDNNQKHT